MHARTSRPWLARRRPRRPRGLRHRQPRLRRLVDPRRAPDHGGAARNAGDRTDAVRKAVVGGHARNVILLIGDGMGDSEITVARNYAKGAAGRFAGIDALPLTGQYTTYSLDQGDRAARLRARLGGHRLGLVDRHQDLRQRDLGQPRRASRSRRCSSSPRRTASRPVTSPPPSCRTPPRPSRSRTSRPAPATARSRRPRPARRRRKENGGLGSITEQLLDTRPDVTLGGGAATFAQTATAGTWAGQTLHAAGRGARLHDGHRQGRPGRASPGPTRTSRCSASSRRATCRCAGSDPAATVRRRRSSRRRRARTTRPARRPSRRWPR